MLQLCLLYLTNFFPSYLSIPGLSRFGMEYKEFATEMETLYDFQYFLMHLRLFDVISNYKQRNLLNIYICKVDNKNTRTRYKTCLKLKIKNKCTRKTSSNGFLLILLLALNVKSAQDGLADFNKMISFISRVTYCLIFSIFI